jgi:hypothetical protein
VPKAKTADSAATAGSATTAATANALTGGVKVTKFHAKLNRGDAVREIAAAHRGRLVLT